MRIEARVKTKNRIKQADTNIELAEAEAAAARDAYRRQQLARRRVDDIMAVLDHRFRDGQPNKQEAEPFVRALLFTLMWEQAGNRTIATKFTANAFPDFDLGELLALANDACAMSNQDVARLLHVGLEERQLLGLAMIGACDLSDYEYAAFVKAEDKRRRAARRRRARPRNLDQRRADESAKREAIASFAVANGVSEKTVRNWIAKRKVTVTGARENGVPSITIIHGDASFPAAKAQRPQAAHAPKAAPIAGSLSGLKPDAPRFSTTLNDLAALSERMPGVVDRVVKTARDSLAAFAAKERRRA